MSYSIETIDLLVREMPPDRMPFTVGQSISAKKRRPRAVWLVRMELRNTRTGKTAIGRSGDRPSFGWLDKRPGLSPERKLNDLISLVKEARAIYLENGVSFDTPFELWRTCHEMITSRAGELGHESLTASYASALLERAVIDGVCRAEEKPLFEMIHGNRLGIDFAAVHPELQGKDCLAGFPGRQRSRFHIRHTVGLSDPLIADDLERPIGDGEPETLEDYVKGQGLRYFKVKISGDAASDLFRLERIWTVVAGNARQPVITLDGNEGYRDIEAFRGFVDELEGRLTGLFQHILFIEQPLTRALTHDPGTEESIRRIGRKKHLVIDEADGTVGAFKEAFGIGYSGASHKNCKGVFKSILNRALCRHFIESTGGEAFLTGEDLSNMAIVPLHQDFDTLSLLDIPHCERNGHHYALGMSHLTAREKRMLEEKHSDLYVRRGDELFLHIEEGAVRCGSVFGPGFGGETMPDWDSMIPLDEWTR